MISRCVKRQWSTARRTRRGRKLYDIQQDFDIEEVIVVTAIRDFPKRLHSYRILSEAFAEVAASQ